MARGSSKISYHPGLGGVVEMVWRGKTGRLGGVDGFQSVLIGKRSKLLSCCGVKLENDRKGTRPAVAWVRAMRLKSGKNARE